MKRCNLCKEEKPLDQFNTERGKSKARCKDCEHAAKNARRRQRRESDPAFDQRVRDKERELYRARRTNPLFQARRRGYQQSRAARDRERAAQALHPDATKLCPVCQEPKPLAEFYPGQVRCKTCGKQLAADYITKRRQTDPTYREKENARNRKLYHERKQAEGPAAPSPPKEEQN